MCIYTYLFFGGISATLDLSQNISFALGLCIYLSYI